MFSFGVRGGFECTLPGEGGGEVDVVDFDGIDLDFDDFVVVVASSSSADPASYSLLLLFLIIFFFVVREDLGGGGEGGVKAAATLVAVGIDANADIAVPSPRALLLSSALFSL